MEGAWPVSRLLPGVQEAGIKRGGETMAARSYNRRELLRLLPKLPKPTGKKLSDSVIHGLRTGFRNKFFLIDLRFGGPWDQSFVPDPKVDLRRKNAARRLAYTLSAGSIGFWRSLNKSLMGGEDYPVLTGVLGILTGALSAGAGVLFSLTTMAISAGKSPQGVLAREGDQVWHLERIGTDSGDIKHVEYFLLVDPFRKKSGTVESAWIIHEGRLDLTLP
jgi:hypothetical protein